MELNETVKLEDGVELIAVPVEDIEATCNGCYFYDHGECLSKYMHDMKCWDKESNELIFKLKK